MKPHTNSLGDTGTQYKIGPVEPGSMEGAVAPFPVSNWGLYEFVELVGEGGIGRVYKARDLRLQRTVALKFLRSVDAKMVESFFREAQAQARIEHANICKVYEVGEVQGLPYISMQYLEGLSLKAAKDRLSLTEKVKVLRDAAEAVHAAHKLGLIHRDIKPANIMLEQSEHGYRPYVMDFGLARDVEAEGHTQTGAIMGTPAYMAPEQVARAFGEADALDGRVDIYSLGATLFEVLTGVPPFGSGTIMELMMRSLQADASSARKLNPEIPVDLETIIMKCLEKEPARRYQSAKALADDLGRFLNGEPIQARPVTLSYRMVKKARKHKGLVAVSAAALCAIVTLTAMAVNTYRTAAEQARLAQQFGREAKEIESIMRRAYLLPLHETGAEKEIVRARMRKIAAQMARLGDTADGPGNYALGRGHLALQEYELAQGYLEKALAAGFQDPEVKYALGQVLGALYQKHLEQAERISNKELREERKREIEKEYRDRALEYLKASRDVQLESASYVEGQIAFYEKRYDEALAKARQAHQQLGWLYEARLLTGDIYVTTGNNRRDKGDYEGALSDYQRAGEEYKAALSMARSDASIYAQDCLRLVQIMIVERSLGRSPEQAFAQAAASCDEALQADYQNWQAYINKSYAYGQLSEYQEEKGGDPRKALEQSIDMAQLAIKYNGNAVATYTILGNAYTKLGKYEQSRGRDPLPSLAQAITTYQKALQANPNFARGYTNLGVVYLEKGKYLQSSGQDPLPALDEAIAANRQAVQINPSFANAYNNLGLVHWEKGRYLQSKGKDPLPSLNEAIAAYEQAIQVNPNYAIAYSNLGLVHWEKGNYQESKGQEMLPTMAEAIAAYQRALQINPNYAFAYGNMGNAYGNISEYELSRGQDPLPSLAQAIAAYEKAIKINPNFGNVYNSLGIVYTIKGRYQFSRGQDPLPELAQAIAAFQRSLQIKPNYAFAHANMGNAYIKIGEYEQSRGQNPLPSLAQAIASFQKALQNNPNYTNAYNYLGNAYLNKGRYEQSRDLNPQPSLKQAVELFERVIKEKPDHVNAHGNLGLAHILLGAERIREKLDPAEAMDKAQQALDRAMQLNDKVAETYQSAALLYRWRVEWQLNTGQPVTDELTRGKAMIAKALALNPQLAPAVAIEGIFSLLEARAAQQHDKKRLLLNQAIATLERALKMNPLLAGEYQPLLTEARQQARKL